MRNTLNQRRSTRQHFRLLEQLLVATILLQLLNKPAVPVLSTLLQILLLAWL
ncbi:hypothetical protein Gohar_003799 [Gossypium harknessii]|uniref:Uncharacterized protein n=1 Tax=Gossypium harknessii TaxID=34285 RepID=A0A7J9IAC1_9ROSI|nr:hypothetical protein [Gossypium harknessii]